MKYMILIAVLVLAALFYFRSSSPYKQDTPTASSAPITFYGSPTCGWCTKQKAEIEGMNIPYVDCSVETEKCSKLGINAYPTFILSDGTVLKGFQSKDKISGYINAPVRK